MISALLKERIMLALRIVLGVYFIVLATLNFVGIAPMVAQFDIIGIGQWFRYFTGVCQLLGGVGLLLSAYAGFGALLVMCVMLGAIVIRLSILGGNPAIAIVILLLSGYIAWQQRHTFLSHR